MSEFKQQIESELRNLLKELRADFESQKDVSVMQRVMYGLEVHQIEQELKSLEFEDTKRQLEEARDRYAELYDFAPIAYVTFDNQAHITELNLAATKLFAEEYNKIINQPIGRWLDEEDSQRFLQHLYEVSYSRKKISTELKLVFQDGRTHYIHLESIAVRDNDGVATRCQTAILDISHTKKTEEKLRIAHEDLEQRVEERTQELQRANEALQKVIKNHEHANEKLRQASIVFDNTEDGIIIMDEATKIVNVNRAFTKILGYTFEELLGKTPKDLLTNRTDNEQYRNMQLTLAKTGHWKGEVWYENKNGEHIPIWANINTVKNTIDVLSHYVAIVTDITSLKETEKKLEHLAHHDVLTGLSNRLNYTANIRQAMKRAQRRKRRLALLLLDLDGFKEINDAYGHAVGDILLKVVAERLQDCVRNEDIVARLGGDEFTVILEDINQFEDAGFIADKILSSITVPVDIERKQIIPKTSIGISMYPDDAKDAEDLLRMADAAMYRSKELGGNTYQFFTKELSKNVVETLTLERQLRQALRNNEFEVYYQPQITTLNDNVVGMEALIRWNHPERGLLSPEQFIEVAEESGLIDDIDNWVLHTACRQIKMWEMVGLPPIRISINMTGRTLLHDENIVKKVRHAIEQADLDPSLLELEMPEKVLKITDKTIGILKELKSIGIRLSVGDFGTGYSSITSLKQLPIDTLKIDRSFVGDIPNNPNDVALTSALIAMGHNLHMKVIAEGVSTNEQMRFLRDQGCDEMQGFLFSKPVSSENARYFMEHHKHN